MASSLRGRGKAIDLLDDLLFSCASWLCPLNTRSPALLRACKSVFVRIIEPIAPGNWITPP